MEETKDEQVQMYLDQIAELKTKMETGMVSKEEYDKLMADHKKLLDDYVNKRTPKKIEVVSKSAKELADTFLTNKPMTNKEYVDNALKYRDAMIKEHGVDPFADKDASPEEVKQVADTLRTLVDESDGDVDFRIKLNATMQDDPMLLSKLRQKRG